jgi:phosphoserine phosphatase
MGAVRDLDSLLDLIISATSDLIHADRSSLFLVDLETGDLWTRVAQGSGTIRLPRGKGIAGTVASEKVTVNIPDAYNDDRFDPMNDRATGYHTRSILAMPLIDHDDRVVGVIQALNQTQGDGTFGERDESLLGALASQAAVAITTAQLIQRDRERQRIERELELAQSIQQGLLLRDMPKVDGWVVTAWQQPCDQTGGDYHDFIPAIEGLDVVMGDVSGHGIAAALMMSTARASLRALHEQVESLPALMERLNVVLEHDMASDAFMTMLIARLLPNGRCRYVAAGHEPPFIYRRATGTFDDLDSTGLMLGVLDHSDYGEEETEALAPGDILVTVTDGIFEASGGENGEDWGLDRFKAAIAAEADRGAEAVLDSIITGVHRHLGKASAQDDLSIVVVERQ